MSATGRILEIRGQALLEDWKIKISLLVSFQK